MAVGVGDSWWSVEGRRLSGHGAGWSARPQGNRPGILTVAVSVGPDGERGGRDVHTRPSGRRTCVTDGHCLGGSHRIVCGDQGALVVDMCAANASAGPEADAEDYTCQLWERRGGARGGRGG